MRPSCFHDVQRRILEQHEEIRARIRGLSRSAEQVDSPWAHRALRMLLLRLAAEFDVHLAFEERELVPRIAGLDAWGTTREAAMRAEHREQRRRIEEVCGLADEPGGENMGLALAVAELGESLLADMLAEERALVELACIDEHGHIDQMTG
jgi:hypothetical protein